MADDKRQAERVPMLGELHGEIMAFQPMLVREISRLGVTVETRFPLLIDSLHDVRLTLSGKSIIVKGRVAHSHISEVDQDTVVYRVGVEFVEPSSAAREAVAAFIDHLKASRSGV